MPTYYIWVPEHPDDQEDVGDQRWLKDQGILEDLTDPVSSLPSHLIICQQSTKVYLEGKLG